MVIVWLLNGSGVADLNLYEGIFAGLLSGISAAGVYSGGKALTGH
jgi:hypothetical protein